MIEWFKKIIRKKLLSAVKSANYIHVSGANKIATTAKIKGASISGDIEIGEHSKIIDGVSISGGKVSIGKYTTINGPNTDLHCKVNSISIGNFCSIARNVSIQEFNHQVTKASSYFINRHLLGGNILEDINSKGSIQIGNDVWIGTQCVILSGVTIGDGAIVAANSVVAESIPPYAIVGGSPAKVLKYRFDNTIIAEMLRTEWWNWDIEKIKRNAYFFRDEVTKDSFNKIQ